MTKKNIFIKRKSSFSQDQGSSERKTINLVTHINLVRSGIRAVGKIEGGKLLYKLERTEGNKKFSSEVAKFC